LFTEVLLQNQTTDHRNSASPAVKLSARNKRPDLQEIKVNYIGFAVLVNNRGIIFVKKKKGREVTSDQERVTGRGKKIEAEIEGCRVYTDFLCCGSSAC